MNNKIKELWIKIKPYILPYAIAIAIPITVGIISAALTKSNMQVYNELKTPMLAPPAWLFPIVWTILFILMGISSGVVYTNRKKNTNAATKALGYYFASLVVNFAWSILFFNLQAAFFALLALIVLLFLIVKTIVEYRKISGFAAYIQIPYAVWVAFAGYLNAAIWIMN